eukprot:g12092.t1
MVRLYGVAAAAAGVVFAGEATADKAGDMPPVEHAMSGGGEAYKYLGCFHDSKGDRVLGDKLPSSGMTTKVCFDYCTDLGSAFMATQYAYECWCSPDGGLDYNRHYEMVGEDAVCDMPCMGDETEMCGGYDSFDLYKLRPSDGGCTTPVEPYEQCGGVDYTGSTCCTEGYACTERGEDGCFLQCRPASTENESTPSPIAAMEEPTDQDCSGAYGQCGGNNYTGATCCPSGYTCVESDEWYSQCRPDGNQPAPSPTPPAPTPVAPAPTPGPVEAPAPTPTSPPVAEPTREPVASPTREPVAAPTPAPVDAPTPEPVAPTEPPMEAPTPEPTPEPSPETPAPQPVASPEPQQPVSGGQYGQTYTGEGTYYGFTTDGNCAYRDTVPGMYDGMIPIALNNEQYGDSLMCGACLEGRANGNGSGSNPIPSTYKGWISDRCPECKPGDLDFSMSGDGRWEIEWEFVPCPGESITFQFEGSNAYYWKIQPRGTRTPVVSLTINGQPASRSQDNFFILEGGPWEGAQTVQTTTVAGVTESTQVTL